MEKRAHGLRRDEARAQPDLTGSAVGVGGYEAQVGDGIIRELAAGIGRVERGSQSARGTIPDLPLIIDQQQRHNATPGLAALLLARHHPITMRLPKSSPEAAKLRGFSSVY